MREQIVQRRQAIGKEFQMPRWTLQVFGNNIFQGAVVVYENNIRDKVLVWSIYGVTSLYKIMRNLASDASILKKHDENFLIKF